ncbi:MAG: L,D-transpeptidase [bacterium]
MRIKRTVLSFLLVLLCLSLKTPPAFTEKNPETQASVPASSESKPETQKSSLPPHRLKIVVNVPTMTLALMEGDKIVKQYNVAVGQPKYPTPPGNYNVERIEWNPWWLPPDSDWAKDAEKTPPGPKNPLGPVKLVMETDLRIHGTNKDKSVGKPSSHACFRMHNEEAKELAWYIQIRASQKTDESLQEKYAKNRSSTFVVPLELPVPVEVVYEPISLKDGQIEIYPDIYWRVKLKDKIADVLQKAGMNLDLFDAKKIAAVKRPSKFTQIPVTSLLQEVSFASPTTQP